MLMYTVMLPYMACWVSSASRPLIDLHVLAPPAGVYDAADTKRFYITVLNYELDQGVHLGSSQLLIASSISSNPADGFLGPYSGSCLTSLHLAHHESTLSTGHAVVC